jgi:hypothetical protein
MSTTSDSEDAETAPSIEVQNLSYAFPDGSSGLKDVSLSLPPGSRTLLIGGEPPPLFSPTPSHQKHHPSTKSTNLTSPPI